MAKRIASAVLLTFVLEALFVAAAAAGVDIIRLPSGDDAKGFANQATATARAAGAAADERPWKCCNRPLCYRSWPVQHCSCVDQVEQCSDACKNCIKVEGSDPTRYVCADWYRGDPGDRCDDQVVIHDHGHGHVAHGATVVRGARKTKTRSDGRPWRCCDRAVLGPTTSPAAMVWYCMDKFRRCDCEHCMEVEDGGYFCLDGYQGSHPGPRCTGNA
ncbi:hypothetical protein ACP4OV_021956 [Aristida adscensionis]